MDSTGTTEENENIGQEERKRGKDRVLPLGGVIIFIFHGVNIYLTINLPLSKHKHDFTPSSYALYIIVSMDIHQLPPPHWDHSIVEFCSFLQ